MTFLEEFHQLGRIVTGGNLNFVTLIPKKQDLSSIKDFCLIFLIWCTYKILTKLLANRLDKVVGLVILDNQSPFVGEK